MEQMPEELLKKDAPETPENASERAYDIAPLERINISFDRSSVQLKLVSKNGFSEYKDFINLLFKNKNFPFLTSKFIKLFCLNCF